MQRSKVLLTGVSGFLGSHTAIQLLEKGYAVTGTIRNPERAKAIRSLIARHTANVNNLHLVTADLLDEPVWKELTKGMDYVQHIASPFPRQLPKHEDDLIRPARTGTLNILKAAADNKVKRVVVTSSIAAIIYGKTRQQLKNVLDEHSWTDELNKKDTTPYYRSKTMAEKAAWEFVKTKAPGLELSVVCPGAILGPVLEDDFGTSANIVIKALDGSTPALPNIGFDIVDVRSVADLLIRAMTMPEAKNQRYIASAGYMTMKEVADVLRQAYPGRKIPARVLPDFFVRLYANFDKTLKPILMDLGIERKLSAAKASGDLQWQPLPMREAVLTCAQSVLELGIVK